MPSFDVVSEIDAHEVDNAVAQAHKEVTARFDFRNTGAAISRSGEGIAIEANSEGRVEAALVVLREKCAKRNVSMRTLDPQPAEAGGKGVFRLKLQEGISKEQAKKITKFIKDSKLKVQSSVQGEQLRVTGKKRDMLQEAIQALRAEDFGVDLQFNNFRD